MSDLTYIEGDGHFVWYNKGTWRDLTHDIHAALAQTGPHGHVREYWKDLNGKREWWTCVYDLIDSQWVETAGFNHSSVCPPVCPI